MTVVQSFADNVSSVADLLRGDFNAHDSGEVIQPSLATSRAVAWTAGGRRMDNL